MFIFQDNGPARHACILHADDDRLVVCSFSRMGRSIARVNSCRIAPTVDELPESRERALGDHGVSEIRMRPAKAGEGSLFDGVTFRC